LPEIAAKKGDKLMGKRQIFAKKPAFFRKKRPPNGGLFDCFLA